MELVIRVIGVKRTFSLGKQKIEALRGADFEVRKGEFVAVVGPSGSGKSTLLGIIGGLDSPTEGRVIIDGIDITHMPESALAKERNRKIGMIFQLFNLIPTLTALENVELPLYLGGHGWLSPSQRAKELLMVVGLEHRLHHKPHELSGGEQQRVAIARALACQPAIVLADEPTGNLDSTAGERILDLLFDLREETGTTFLLATHDQRIAERADRKLLILDGRIIS